MKNLMLIATVFSFLAITMTQNFARANDGLPSGLEENVEKVEQDQQVALEQNAIETKSELNETASGATDSSEVPALEPLNEKRTNRIASNEVQMDMMNVQGEVDLPKPVKKETASDRLRKMRAALERKNELIVRRKIEEMRLKQELLMMQKIQRAMNQTMQNLDKIN